METLCDAVRIAIHCRHLRRTLQPGVPDDLIATCLHPVRDGDACVGPFLEDVSTCCGLWERHPQSDLIPRLRPEPWPRRSRRLRYDAAVRG